MTIDESECLNEVLLLVLIKTFIYSLVQWIGYTFDAVWSKFDSIPHQKCIQFTGPNCMVMVSDTKSVDNEVVPFEGLIISIQLPKSMIAINCQTRTKINYLYLTSLFWSSVNLRKGTWLAQRTKKERVSKEA